MLIGTGDADSLRPPRTGANVTQPESTAGGNPAAYTSSSTQTAFAGTTMTGQEAPLLCFLGHAGFALATKSCCLLMDPWLSGKGAFLKTWFPYPDNTGLADQVINYVGRRQLYVYISHVHEDHFDPDFLRRLEPLNPVYLLPGFTDDSLRRGMEALPCKKYFLRDSEHFKLDGDFSVQLFLEESGINTDSAILASCNGRTFLNLNDCKLHDRLPTIKMPAIDVFTCQFSGATWHPLCYEYDKATYQAISIKRKNAKFFQVEKAIRALNPAVFLPAAGPPVFLHPRLYERNFETINIFPKAEEFASYLGRRKLKSAVHILRPGQGLELGAAAVQEILRGNNAPDLESYRKSKESLFTAGTELDPDILLGKLFQEVQLKLQRFKTNLTTQFTILFGVAGAAQQIQINLNTREAVLTGQYTGQGPLYTITAAPEAVAALVSHSIEWENFCLSFLFKIRRYPDEYCPLVNIFFFCSPANVAAALSWLEAFRSNDARIEITTPMGRYTCRRFCPHQGADLTYGHEQDGFWICPRHRWRFELARGGRSEDGSCSIDALLVDNP